MEEQSNWEKNVNKLIELENKMMDYAIQEMNLIEGLQSEMNRCRELLKFYEEIPQGIFGAAMIDMAIRRAEQSIANGDAVEMLSALEQLKACA